MFFLNEVKDRSFNKASGCPTISKITTLYYLSVADHFRVTSSSETSFKIEIVDSKKEKLSIFLIFSMLWTFLN